MENYTVIIFDPAVETAPPSDLLHAMFGDIEVAIRFVFGVFLCGILSLCGLVTNAIVMAVFYRQGIMKESSTVSLFTLAVADFLFQLSHITLSVTDVVEFAEENGYIGMQYIDPLMVNFIAFFDFKIIVGHTICWLTAYLSFERCFSVLFPFKVKLIFSPRNSVIALTCVFVGALFTLSPHYTEIGITEKTVNNMTIVTYYWANAMGLDLIEIGVFLNPVVLRNLGIFIVVISNILILIKVQSSKDWRKSKASSGSADDNEEKNKNKNAFKKEAKLIKMVSMISAIFILCTVPDMISVVITELGYAPVGSRLWFALYGFNMFVESFNSSVNLFVYYFMSTSFNKGFKQLFGLDKKQ